MLNRKLTRLCVTVGAVAAATVFLIPVAAMAGFGIDPGKVYIDNLYPGAQAEFTIIVYNQGDSNATYNIIPRLPDHTDPGYEPFPHLDWVTVTPENVTVAAGGKAAVAVVVKMPEDARDYLGRKAEAWISFTVAGGDDMVQIEIASRVFISTRAEETTPPASQPPSQAVTQNDGSGGISPEPQKPADTSSTTDVPLVSNNKGYSWVPLAAGLGSLAGGLGIYMLVKKRRARAG